MDALIGLPIAMVACGSRHTVAVTRQGALYSWGDRESGVAGHGDILGHQFTPRLVERLAGKRIVQISVRFNLRNGCQEMSLAQIITLTLFYCQNSRHVAFTPLV